MKRLLGLLMAVMVMMGGISCAVAENANPLVSDWLTELKSKRLIQIVEDDGKLVWECPHCGNRDQEKLNVARRTCGYIGTQFWNQGRTQEIKDRVLHL